MLVCGSSFTHIAHPTAETEPSIANSREAVSTLPLYCRLNINTKCEANEFEDSPLRTTVCGVTAVFDMSPLRSIKII